MASAGVPPLPTDDAGLEQYYGDAPRGVRANMVQSVDGAGAFHGRTKAISDPVDQVLLKHLRGYADAIVVGAATVQAEKYGPVRLSEETRAEREKTGYAAVPPLVVVTARAMLSSDLPIFDPTGPRTIIATVGTAADAHPELAEVADVVVVGEAELEPERLLAALRERGLERILCEGGPFLLSQLIERDLVDDMCLTVSPYLAGSQPTTAQPPSARDEPTRLRLRHALTHDDLIYLRYSR